jgi:hypothetical protein
VWDTWDKIKRIQPEFFDLQCACKTYVYQEANLFEPILKVTQNHKVKDEKNE